MRRRKMKMLVAAGAGIAALATAAGLGLAMSGGDDKETPITGDALQRASAAALAYIGGGRVTETEAGDEEGAYEVEVTLDNGDQVDVHLDERFNVISAEGDGAGDDGD